MGRLQPTYILSKDGGEIKNIQHYCPAEHVHSVAFLPRTIHNLLASANNKVIRQYDLRLPGPSKESTSGGGAIAQWATRAVNGITPDPSEESTFVSWENGQIGSTVKVWDVRKPREEMLSFEVGEGGVVALEWMGRGRLGVGMRNGVAECQVVTVSGQEEWTTLGGMRTGKCAKTATDLDMTRTLAVVKSKQPMQDFAFDKKGEEVLFVVKDGTIGIGPVTFAPVVGLPSLPPGMWTLIRAARVRRARRHRGLCKIIPGLCTRHF